MHARVVSHSTHIYEAIFISIHCSRHYAIVVNKIHKVLACMILNAGGQDGHKQVNKRISDGNDCIEEK